MDKAYRRASNCGPVPYPDGSGKMLTDEVVSGTSWEPLEALGYVVPHVEGDSPAPARVELVPEAPRPVLPEPAKTSEDDGVKLAGDGGAMKEEQAGTKSSNVAGEGSAGDKRGGRGGKRGGSLNG